MRSPNEIVELAHSARIDAGPLHYRKAEIAALYNGDIAVPLTEMYADEKASTANLARQGIDGTAQRIASTNPEIRWHPKRAGFKEHEDVARRKRQVSLGWHEANAIDLIRLRRARHIIAYSESPVQVGWDRKRNIPSWNVWDPLGTFTAPPARLDDMVPEWVTRNYLRSLGWVKKHYPDAWLALRKGENDTDKTMVEIVEYRDEDEVHLVVTGKAAESWHQFGNTFAAGRFQGDTLESVPNPAHRQSVVVPGRVGLTEERRGQFDGMVGKYIRQARLDALELIAIEEGIFPKQWLVGRPGEVPKIIQIADPRKGQVGIIQGGVLDTQNLNPGYKTREAKADLERAARIDGGVPGTFTGESISGARTARLSDSIEGGAVDFGIAEIQKILARSEQQELEIAAETAKAVAGNVSVSMYVTSKGSAGNVSYKADELFESCSVTVRYPIAGTDRNQLIQRVGMMQQLGHLSDQTAREMNPEVEDAEMEKDRLTSEGIEKALLASIQTGAAQPDGPYTPDQLARIAELVRTDKMELFEAVATVNREAQEAQAALPPPAPEGMSMDPSQAPGLLAPSASLPTAPEAPPDASALAGALSGLVQGAAA